MALQGSYSEYYYFIDDYKEKSDNETISGSGNCYIHQAIFSYYYVFLLAERNYLKYVYFIITVPQKMVDHSIYQSECVLVHICILLSSSTSYGCGYYIESVQDSTDKRYAIECSVSKCRGEWFSFYHSHGDIQVSNMNTSYHHDITSYAAYSIGNPTDTWIMNFTTASNTSSSDQGGMFIYGFNSENI